MKDKSTGPESSGTRGSETQTKVFLRTQYNYDTKAHSDEFSRGDFGESMTIQSMAEEADINVLIARFGVGPIMPKPGDIALPHYGDYTEVTDYRTAIERTNEAREAFMQLPAKVRAQFANDPQQFLEFCTTPGHEKELRALGLLQEPKPEPELSRDTKAIIDALKPSKEPPGGGTPKGQTGNEPPKPSGTT